MSEPEPRCEKTDMLVSGCDHCRPNPQPVPGAPRSHHAEDEIQSLRPRGILAQFGGYCRECHQKIEADEHWITQDADGLWVHVDCA